MHRISSLWDLMQTFNATGLITLTEGLHGLTFASKTREGMEVMHAPIEEKTRLAAKANMERLQQAASSFGLVATGASARRLANDLAWEGVTYYAASRSADEIIGRLRDEMEGRLLFLIDLDKGPFFTTRDLFGREVGTHFPTAAIDIEEAGKCLALGRGTACVFHLMRVLEIGLHSLAKELGLPEGVTEQNWQKIINDVNGAIGRLPHSTPEEKRALAIASDKAVKLQQVKDAWRNDVMHPRAIYTEEEAAEIFECAKRLMKSLAA